MGFLNWAPGEPNNVGNGENGEDCVHLTSEYHNVGMWNDEECDRQENYICKRHKGMLLSEYADRGGGGFGIFNPGSIGWEALLGMRVCYQNKIYSMHCHAWIRGGFGIV